MERVVLPFGILNDIPRVTRGCRSALALPADREQLDAPTIHANVEVMRLAELRVSRFQARVAAA